MVNRNTKIIDGPIFTRLFLFTAPIMLTGLLQVAYNMADNIVVGRFSGDEYALAAVGSTSSLTTLIVNFLMGISTGAGVVIAHAFGAGDRARTERAVRTAMSCSIGFGLAFSILAFIISKPVLALMGTKAEVFDSAVLYFRIICLGIPASTFYNFGNAALRSLGNSRLSLYILSLSGILNVVFNLFFVIVCNMTVDGVALATVISQYASAISILLYMSPKRQHEAEFSLKNIAIDRNILGRILRIGFPAGLQSSIFSLSNIILTSGCNTLPTAAVSARTISFNIDGMVYTAMDSYTHSVTTYIGQNFGARKPDRIRRTMLFSILQVTAVGLILGQLIIAFSKPIISMYIAPDDPNFNEVQRYAMDLTKFILSFYFIAGIMNTLNGISRGLGNSIAPMIIGIIGTCVIRIVWVYAFFPMEIFHTLDGLYYCYPITWIFSIICLIITVMWTYKRAKRSGQLDPLAEAA